jgi:hypothetical protein
MSLNENEELMMEQYKELCSLHKFYIEILLKSAAFVNTVIAAIVVYILKINGTPTPTPTPKIDSSLLYFGLVFPLVLALGFSVILFFACPKCIEFRDGINSIAKHLKIGVAPHVQITLNMCVILSIFYFIVSIGIGALLAAHFCGR